MTPEKIEADVVDYYGYKVSRCGKISGKRVEFLKPWVRHGYSIVSVYTNGKLGQKFVHSIVAECFLGKKPKGMFVCHNNGIKSDNRVENLRYDTQANNEIDKIKHGSALIGSRHFNCKLSQADVDDIRALYKSKCRKNGATALSRKYNVHPTTIGRIVRKETRVIREEHDDRQNQRP